MSFIRIDNSRVANPDYSLTQEVIQTNNFGAYSYSALIGLNTRKYHSLLAVPQPQIDQDQHTLLSAVLEDVGIDQMIYQLGTQQYSGVYTPRGYKYIVDIEVDPIFEITYDLDRTVFTKETLLLKNENRVLIRYTLADSRFNVVLKLKPFLAFRNKHTLCKSNFDLNSNLREVAKGVSFKLYDSYDDL